MNIRHLNFGFIWIMDFLMSDIWMTEQFESWTINSSIQMAKSHDYYNHISSEYRTIHKPDKLQTLESLTSPVFSWLLSYFCYYLQKCLFPRAKTLHSLFKICGWLAAVNDTSAHSVVTWLRIEATWKNTSEMFTAAILKKSVLSAVESTKTKLA